MYEVALPWQLPRDMKPEWIIEARQALPLLEQASLPASYQKKRKWLAKLGVLCAGLTENARAKIDEYAELIDVPDMVLNRENLREAGRQFRYFPSFKDLDHYLSELADPIRQLNVRLEAIANAVPSLPSNPFPMSPNGGKTYAELDDDEKAAHEGRMKLFRAGSKDGRPHNRLSMSEMAKPRSTTAGKIIEASLARSLDHREPSESSVQLLKIGGQ